MATPVMYELMWRAKWLADGSKTIDEMAKALRDAADELDQMKAAGVTLEDVVKDDYATLLTEDAAVAAQFGFTSQEELYPDDDGADH